jgi:hypothetical protein
VEHDDGGVAPAQRGGAEPGDREPRIVEPAGHRPPAERRQHDGRRQSDLEPQRGAQDVVERGGRDVRGALELEQDRHGGAPVDGERVLPAELVERGVERRAGVLRGGVAEAALEEVEVGAVHQRSFPRSRSRRAMMLRWISALPP